MRWKCETCETVVSGPLTDDTTCKCKDPYCQAWARIDEGSIEKAIERVERRCFERCEVTAGSCGNCATCLDNYALRIVIAAAKEQATLLGWLPIDSAPKNGTLILGFAVVDSQTGNWRMRIMSHDSYAEVGMRNNWRGWGDNWVGPTHWMPLPAPPLDDPTPSQVGHMAATHNKPCSCWMCSHPTRPEPKFRKPQAAPEQGETQ